MDRTNMSKLLTELCALRGVSGNEGAVRRRIIKEIEGHCTYQVDALGNIIAFKKGARSPKNKIQISAHMDEVGFLITNIDPDGFLRFTAVGGIDPAVVVGKHLLVGEDALPGAVGIKPIHLSEGDERDAIPKMDDLTIDIGAKDRDEALTRVSPGDWAVFDSPLVPFGRDHMTGRALDDRAGCAVMIQLILQELPADCWFTFTVQEETGCAGGRTAAYTVDPGIGIALETTAAGDVEGTPDYKQVCRLGEGPVIYFMDKGTLYDRDLYRMAFTAAKDCGVTCQSKQGVSGVNESRCMQTARAGARVLAAAIPCRYIHSPSCVLRMCDVEAMTRYIPALLEKLADL